MNLGSKRAWLGALLLLGAALLGPACAGSQTADGSDGTASAAHSTTAASPMSRNPALSANATVVFSAFGGQGVQPADADPDSFYRVVAVVDITVADDAPINELTVDRIELLDDRGNAVASMRELVSVGQVTHTPGQVTWETAMNERGAPFTGKLDGGTTRLRVEAFLKQRPKQPPVRARVGFSGATTLLIAEGPVMGEWPTG